MYRPDTRKYGPEKNLNLDTFVAVIMQSIEIKKNFVLNWVNVIFLRSLEIPQNNQDAIKFLKKKVPSSVKLPKLVKLIDLH